MLFVYATMCRPFELTNFQCVDFNSNMTMNPVALSCKDMIPNLDSPSDEDIIVTDVRPGAAQKRTTPPEGGRGSAEPNAKRPAWMDQTKEEVSSSCYLELNYLLDVPLELHPTITEN